MKLTFKKILKNPLYIFNIPFLLFIKVYQFFLSFDHGIPSKLFPGVRVCRHFPSCSAFTYEAIEMYGPIKGGLMGTKRVASCGPWTPANTYDPVPHETKKK